MGRLVIKFTQQKNQLFPLDEPGRYVLGRGEDCAVVLPNVSVSREHAAVVVGRQGAVIEDLESANGTLINGESIRQHLLVRGDEIQIGKFSMVYLGDGREDRFYKGRYVAYLPRYDPKTVVPDDDAATFAMSVEALSSGRIERSAGPGGPREESRAVLLPEERGIIGRGRLVPSKASDWGVPTEITWDGKSHILEKKAIFTRVKVNGESVSRRPLGNGDRLQVGASLFRYERPKR